MPRKNKPFDFLEITKGILNDPNTQFHTEGQVGTAVGCLTLKNNPGDDSEEPGHLPVLLTVEIQPLLSLAAAAAEMQVSERTLERWVQDGAPVVYRSEGKRRKPLFPRESLTRYAASVGHKPGTIRCGTDGRRPAKRRRTVGSTSI